MYTGMWVHMHIMTVAEHMLLPVTEVCVSAHDLFWEVNDGTTMAYTISLWECYKLVSVNSSVVASRSADRYCRYMCTGIRSQGWWSLGEGLEKNHVL